MHINFERSIPLSLPFLKLGINVQVQKQLWEMSVSAVQEHLSPDILDMYGGVKEEEEEEEEEEEIRKGSERQEN